MKNLMITTATLIAFALGLCAPTQSYARKEAKAKPAIESMSKEEMIKTARSAAPPSISDKATIMLPGPEGKFTEAVKGTNEFTCIPDISRQEKADPFCGDREATKWIMDALAKKEKPSNEKPGVAYMMRGGFHWEKDGKIVMPETAGAKRVKEPPHWMVFWPFEPEKTGLPTKPSRHGTYIMYDGTPYAHLMVHQNPKELVK